MQRRIRPHRFVEVLCLALLVEERILVCLVDQKVKLKVSPRELHTAGDGSPFTESNRLAVCGAIGEGIAADDVLPQHIAETSLVRRHPACGLVRRRLACGAICYSQAGSLRTNDLGEQPLPAGLGIILQQLDAIARAYSDETAEFPLGGRLYVMQK